MTESKRGILRKSGMSESMIALIEARDDSLESMGFTDAKIQTLVVQEFKIERPAKITVHLKKPSLWTRFWHWVARRLP